MSKAWSKDMYIDPHTFGGTKACEILVDMMNKNVIPVYEKHRVLSFINNTIFQFNGLSFIPYEGVRRKAMSLMLEETLARISKMTYPPLFISFLKNVICHHSRRALDEVNWVIAERNF